MRKKKQIRPQSKVDARRGQRVRKTSPGVTQRPWMPTWTEACTIQAVNPDWMSDKSWNSFIALSKELLEPTAKEKGYNSTGTEGKNELFDFVQSIVGGSGHALGEIIYKVIRYKNKKDEKDLLKIVAWVYLIWKFGK